MSSLKRSRASFEPDGLPSHAPFAIYGTPLPAFDPEVRDDGSYVPIWKQEVTDERGRKRLHGAFTGGWSAGYFNTVGSKEGWAPSNFVSSRSSRAKAQSKQQAEDYMDDEDLADKSEKQKLETQGDFAGLGSMNSGGSKGMFSDIFLPAGETIGIKLLQRMGWRQGQGIGPKVKRRAQGDKQGEAHLFAPENSSTVSFHRKTDRKGLGFTAHGRLGEIDKSAGDEGDAEENETDARILSDSRSKLLANPKKAKKSSFGVGILNDTGSDDEDPYAIGPQIKYNRIIGGDKKLKKGGITASTTVQKPKFTSQKLAQRSANTSSLLQKCHDGRLALHGFVLASSPVVLPEGIENAPPTIPPGWRSSKRATKFSDTAPSAFVSTAEVARSSTMDQKGRADLLGEQMLSGKSVFDYLTPATRDKLAVASGKADLPQARGEGAPVDSKEKGVDRRTLWDLVPSLDKDVAAAALQRGSSGWMPYAEDETKRRRYKYFLSLQAGLETGLPTRTTGSSLDEWAKELREFAQAAEVFKPISGLMATRFTSSSAAPKMASDRPDPVAAETKSADPAEEAARMGMFGPMTRSRVNFYPTRLLCKRFNVKPPVNVGADQGITSQGQAPTEDKRGDLVSQSTLNSMMMHANFKLPNFTRGAIEGGDGAVSAKDSQLIEVATVDANTNEAVEGRRADESMLKSVFEDDV